MFFFIFGRGGPNLVAQLLYQLKFGTLAFGRVKTDRITMESVCEQSPVSMAYALPLALARATDTSVPGGSPPEG